MAGRAARGFVRVLETGQKAVKAADKVATALERGGKGLDLAAQVAERFTREIGAASAGPLSVRYMAGAPIYMPVPEALRFPAYCQCDEAAIERGNPAWGEGTKLFKCHTCQQRMHMRFNDGAGEANGAAAAAPVGRRGSRSKSRNKGAAGAGAAPAAAKVELGIGKRIALIAALKKTAKGAGLNAIRARGELRALGESSKGGGLRRQTRKIRRTK